MPDNDGLVTLADASAKTGYTVQHLARLLRQHKIAGKKLGPLWLTTVEAIEVYRRSDPRPGPKPGKEQR